MSPCKLGYFSAPERSGFSILPSLFKIFHLCKFCSPLFSFFWFVPGFVEVDQVVKRLLSVWVSVTKFETAAFECLNQEWLCFVVITLLFIKYSQVVLGFQCVWMLVNQFALPAISYLLEQGHDLIVLVPLCVEYGQHTFQSTGSTISSIHAVSEPSETDPSFE